MPFWKESRFHKVKWEKIHLEGFETSNKDIWRLLTPLMRWFSRIQLSFGNSRQCCTSPMRSERYRTQPDWCICIMMTETYEIMLWESNEPTTYIRSHDNTWTPQMAQGHEIRNRHHVLKSSWELDWAWEGVKSIKRNKAYEISIDMDKMFAFYKLNW